MNPKVTTGRMVSDPPWKPPTPTDEDKATASVLLLMRRTLNRGGNLQAAIAHRLHEIAEYQSHPNRSSDASLDREYRLLAAMKR